jgi:hypothetical protein
MGSTNFIVQQVRQCRDKNPRSVSASLVANRQEPKIVLDKARKLPVDAAVDGRSRSLNWW